VCCDLKYLSARHVISAILEEEEEEEEKDDGDDGDDD